MESDIKPDLLLIRKAEKDLIRTINQSYPKNAIRFDFLIEQIETNKEIYSLALRRILRRNIIIYKKLREIIASRKIEEEQKIREGESPLQISEMQSEELNKLFQKILLIIHILTELNPRDINTTFDIYLSLESKYDDKDNVYGKLEIPEILSDVSLLR